MCEFLIRIEDTAHPDPIKNQMGAYKVGDIVQVYPDGSMTEPINPSTRHACIKIPGLEFNKDWHKPHKIKHERAEERRPVLSTKRLFKFDLSKLSPTNLRELITERTITIRLDATIKRFIIHKPTGDDERTPHAIE